MNGHRFSSFVSDLSKHSPLAIHENIVYVTTDSQTDNWFDMNNVRVNLTPFSSVRELEEINYSVNKDKILQARDEAVNTKLNEVYENIQGPEANLQNIVKFATMNVMPLMIDNAAEISMLLGVDDPNAKTGREVIEELISKHKVEDTEIEDLKKLTKKLTTQARANFTNRDQLDLFGDEIKAGKSPLTSRLFGGRSVLVYGNNFYSLVPTNEANFPHGKVKMSDSEYSLSEMRDSEYIDIFYSDYVFRAECSRIISERADSFLENATNTDKVVQNTLVEEGSFSYGNLGWKLYDERLYLYWEVPKFAMRNPIHRDRYHPFPATKIAVPLNYSGGRVFDGKPCIIDAMAHPFLRDWDRGYQGICNLAGVKYGNSPEEIVRTLSDTINVFTNGLTIKSLDQHGEISENSPYFGVPLKKSLYANGHLSLEKAREEGYLITNHWHLEEGVEGEDKNE